MKPIHGLISLACVSLIAADAGTNLLQDEPFHSLGTAGSVWTVESQGGAQMSAGKFKLPDGKPAVRLTIDRVGTEIWHAQFFQQHISIKAGTTYELSVGMKAVEQFDPSSPPSVDMTVLMASPPWTTAAVRSCTLSGDAQHFKLRFTARETIENARVTFSSGTSATDLVIWSPVLVEVE